MIYDIEGEIPNLSLKSCFKRFIGVPGALTEGRSWEYGWESNHGG